MDVLLKRKFFDGNQLHRPGKIDYNGDTDLLPSDAVWERPVAEVVEPSAEVSPDKEPEVEGPEVVAEATPARTLKPAARKAAS